MDADGVEVKDVTELMFGMDYAPADWQKVRRRLEKLTNDGLVARSAADKKINRAAVYRPITPPITGGVAE